LINISEGKPPKIKANPLKNKYDPVKLVDKITTYLQKQHESIPKKHPITITSKITVNSAGLDYIKCKTALWASNANIAPNSNP